jgi:hypothetical protein
MNLCSYPLRHAGQRVDGFEERSSFIFRSQRQPHQQPVIMTRLQTTEGTAVAGDIRLSLIVRADAASEQAGGPAAAGERPLLLPLDSAARPDPKTPDPPQF